MAEVESPEAQPKAYVLIHSVAKRANVGELLRCCAGFGVHEVVMVGKRQFASHGDHGAGAFLNYSHFSSLDEAASRLKAKAVDVVGVEICESALSVSERPFRFDFEGYPQLTTPRRDTAFLLGNEGQGLSEREMAVCDYFVYIPQFGSGTASLNVTVAGAIILHNFATWAGYQERRREGPKYFVGERPVRTSAKGSVPLSAEEQIELRHAREAKRAAKLEGEDDGEDTLDDVFREEEPVPDE